MEMKNNMMYVVFENYYHEGALTFEETIGIFNDINIAKDYIEEKSNENILDELIKLRSSLCKEKNRKDITLIGRLERMSSIKFKWQDFENCNFYKPFIKDKIYTNFREYVIIPYELNRKYNSKEIFHGIWNIEKEINE